MNELDQSAQLLAVLFASSKPLAATQLALILKLTPDQLTNALATLRQRLKHSGLQLIQQAGQLELATDPAAADSINRLRNSKPATLTPAALETLAIVAYRQPVSRQTIDNLRGVSSEIMVNHLLDQGLIETTGTTDTADHSPVYGTSMLFLELAGLSDITALPPVEEANES